MTCWPLSDGCHEYPCRRTTHRCATFRISTSSLAQASYFRSSRCGFRVLQICTNRIDFRTLSKADVDRVSDLGLILVMRRMAVVDRCCSEYVFVLMMNRQVRHS